MMNFSTGLSALRAAQFAINTGAHNLANANTAGYHRQRVELSSVRPQWMQGQYIGAGVEIKNVARLRNQVLEGALTNATSDLSRVRESLAVVRQLESQFLPGNGSIHDNLTNLFAELGKLSTNPSEPVSAIAVIQKGGDLAQQIREISHRVNGIKGTVGSQIFIEVEALNREIEELVDLQNQIKRIQVRGPEPNDLYDRRDQLVNRLAEKIDIQRFEQLQGGFALSLGNSSISLGTVPVKFEATYREDGSIALQIAGTQRPIDANSGSLSSLLELHNQTIGQYQTQLNQFAATFMQEFDQIHAQGIGNRGPFNLLRSTRSINSTDQAINQAGLAFPVRPGELMFSVTDPNGERRLDSITIDPAIDSIQDIATRISQIDNLQGVVDSVSGQISIFAEPGFHFDFTGRLETIPKMDTFTGSAVPRIAGNFTGSQNRQFQVTIIGSGTVGQTPGLMARVTDAESGMVISEIDIGSTYQAGQNIVLAEGVELSFSGGDVNDGDSFQTRLIHQADSTGILAALGLNSFFQGRNATDIQVSNELRNDPARLAVSRTGERADTANVARFLALSSKPVVGSDPKTLQDFLGDLSTGLGFEVRSRQYVESTLSNLKEQYEMEINSVSGVDMNEELIIMNQFQRQYEASVQVLRAIDNMMAELMRLVQ